jgi:hypothetical protein
MGKFHGPRSSVLGIALAMLTGCPTVDLGDTPEDINLCNPAGGIDYFRDVIYPMYLKAETPADAKSCARTGNCHQSGGGTPFNLVTGASRDDNVNFKAAQQFLNCGTVEDSTLLTRPLKERDSHGGDALFDEASPEHQMFLDWFQ